MTMQSFKTMFKFAQLLGLVEFLREEPMQFPPSDKQLYTVEMVEGQPRAKISNRRIFRISPVGAEDEKAWSNLTAAWKESWPVPQKLDYEVPSVPEPVTHAPKSESAEVTEFTEYVRYAWNPRPSIKRIKSLITYLESAEHFGPTNPSIRRDLEQLSQRIGDWAIFCEDEQQAAQASGDTAEYDRWTRWLTAFETVGEVLTEADASAAIAALQSLI